MKKIAIIIILLVLGINFSSIVHTLIIDFRSNNLNSIAVIIYSIMLIIIAVLIYVILLKKPKTPLYLCCYFTFCLITTVIEIIYLSSIEAGTKPQMIHFLVYFCLFVYAAKSHYLRHYFHNHSLKEGKC
ncbi:hypothetical protein [Orbus sasakiae]|uniref:hypothetical protein n=1 Tax=Orbus sasakiae TaxID=1078475 RepID=UPI0031E6BBF4